MFALSRDSLREATSRRSGLGAIFVCALMLALMIALMGVSEVALARPGDRLAVRAQSRNLCVFAPAVCLQVSADRPGAGGPPAQRGAGLRARVRAGLRTERAMQAIDSLRLKKLAQTLNLNDEQKKLIRDAYSRELARKRDLIQERMHILSKMRQLTLATKPADLQKSEPEMRDLVVNFRRVQREIVETEWTTQDEILGRLTPDQRVRCILFNEAFDRKLRAVLGETRQER